MPHSLFPTRSRPALALLALLGAGCHDNYQPTIADDAGSTVTSCAACIANQESCVTQADALVCVPCGAGTVIDTAGQCQPIAGTAVRHDFPTFTTASGAESLGLCRSWTLGNDVDLWVNTVELSQDEGSHHSNWTFVPETSYAGPDGVWPCQDRGWDIYSATAVGGVVYAQSTQSTHEVQRFPTGSATRIPAHSRIVSDVHLLNVTAAPLTGHATLTLYTVPQASVRTPLTVFHMEYDALHLPPRANSRVQGRCSVASTLAASGQPFNFNVYYVLPHYHTHGTGFSLALQGGPNDGQSLFALTGLAGEAHGRAIEPAVNVTGADGFRFACQYQNPTTSEIGWGFGSEEMCEVFGWSDSPVAFQSRVNTGAPSGTDGNVQLFSGDCDTELLR